MAARRKIEKASRLTALAALALSFALLPAAASAQGEIVAVRAKSLSLYESPEGGKVKALDPAEVPTPLDIEQVAPNKRLRVTIGGETFWLAPYQVILAEGVEVEDGCLRLSPQYASTRALGSC